MEQFTAMSTRGQCSSMQKLRMKHLLVNMQQKFPPGMSSFLFGREAYLRASSGLGRSWEGLVVGYCKPSRNQGFSDPYTDLASPRLSDFLGEWKDQLPLNFRLTKGNFKAWLGVEYSIITVQCGV